MAIMDTFVKMRHYINFNKSILPHRVMLLEDRINENEKKINELFDKFDPKDIAKKLIIFNGEIFKAYYIIETIFDSAKEEIIIIDNYANKELLMELSKYNKKTIIVSKNVDEVLIKKYKQEFKNIEFIYNDKFHDRFMIIDRKQLYSCGASFKDLGNKCSAINLIEEKVFLDIIIEKLFNN